MRRRITISPTWQAHLATWPGLLTLLSVLAVLLGTPVPLPEHGQRVAAGSVAPALPELRAAPSASPVVPLHSATPPEPYRLPPRHARGVQRVWFWSEPLLGVDLTALGRRQTDGG